MSAAVEGVRFSISDYYFPAVVRCFNEALDVYIEILYDDDNKQRHDDATAVDTEPADPTSPAPAPVFDFILGSEDIPADPGVDEKIEVRWKLDQAYYSSHIKFVSDAVHVLQYDNGKIETLHLSMKAWGFCAAYTVCRDSLALKN